MRAIADRSGVDRLSRKLTKAADEMPRRAATLFRAGLYTLIPDVEAVYKAVTPVLTGNLERSTTASITIIGDGLEAEIAVDQPAQNERGDQYARFLIQGHRIVAWGHDTGRYQPPNPYPDQARIMVAPMLQRAMKRTGEETMIALTTILHEP